MKSHIFYYNTRGKNLFQLPSHAKVHQAISFGAMFISGRLEYWGYRVPCTDNLFNGDMSDTE